MLNLRFLSRSPATGRVSRAAGVLAFIVSCLALTVAFGTAWADAPGRVARLGEYTGDVQLANEREDWHPISRNYAVTAGDNLWVSDGGRAELDVGGLQLWLAGGANVYFEQFDDFAVVARLAQGAMIIRVRAVESGDAMRVLLPQGELAFLEPGFYVVSAGAGYAPGSPGALTVRRGRAEVVAGGPPQVVNRGETVVLDGIGVRYDSYPHSLPGGFEAWANARDRRIDRWENRYGSYSNPWLIGVRDLDDYGSWTTTYEYGRIWYPTTVAANWAPYRFGRWAWVQPWGWTWIDDAPWGFAPAHYGRWVRIGGRWGWSPGEYVGRPVYAPALVTFFGGNGWSVNASVGPTFSWVPLGWNEPYVPWYTYSPNYWRQVNRPYVRNLAEEPWRPRTYVHAAVPGAVTAVPSAAFVSGRPVAQAYVRNLAEGVVRNAPPARIGEVVPQFAPARSAGPDVVRGAPPSVQVPQQQVRPGEINRFPASGGVRERAPVVPNTNVVQPATRDDPNPVVGRPAAPSQPLQPVQPKPPFPQPPQSQAPRPYAMPPGQTSPNPALREPGTPMPKERGPQQRPLIVEQQAPSPVPRPVERNEYRAAPTPALPPRAQPAPTVPPVEQRPSNARPVVVEQPPPQPKPVQKHEQKPEQPPRTSQN